MTKKSVILIHSHQMAIVVLAVVIFFFTFFKDFIYLFLERGEGREKERERNINVWLPFACPNWGAGQQPRHVPQLKIKTGDPLVHSPHSIR